MLPELRMLVSVVTAAPTDSAIPWFAESGVPV